MSGSDDGSVRDGEAVGGGEGLKTEDIQPKPKKGSPLSRVPIAVALIGVVLILGVSSMVTNLRQAGTGDGELAVKQTRRGSSAMPKPPPERRASPRQAEQPETHFVPHASPAPQAAPAQRASKISSMLVPAFGGGSLGVGRGVTPLGETPDREAEQPSVSEAAAEAAPLARMPAGSRYLLQAGSIIPAVLETQINSQLPGVVRAIVSMDVLDGITGRHVLIPAGTRLIGAYDTDVNVGEKRVLLGFERMIFPDGSSVDISGQQGADGLGAAGLGDRVNNHFWRVARSALLLTAINAGARQVLDDERGVDRQRPDFGSSSAEGLAQQSLQTTNRLLERDLNVAPTLSVRPGFVFSIVLDADLVFASPYVRHS